MNKKNKRFHEALYKTHSFYSDPADPAQPLPLVAELEKLYDENVPFKLAASELGTTEEALRDVIKKSQAIRNKLYPNDFLSPSDPTLKRVFFETAYCDIKSALPQSQVVDKKTTAPIQEHSRIQKNH